MRPHSILPAIAATALALGFPLREARAQYVSGNATTQAVGGTTQYIYLPGPESTTGPVQTIGTCSSASALATLSASAGTHVALSYAGATPVVSCAASAYGYDNIGYQDNFVIQSGTLAPGTLVDVSLCAHAAIRHGATFQCGGNINEAVTNQANTDVSLVYGTMSQTAHGAYAERFDCSDPHGVSETGLYAPGGGQTLTLTGVPVGGTVTVSTATSISSAATSVLYGSEAHVEVALVIGYSSASDVKLVSTANSTELNPARLCSDSIAASLLPPNPGVLAVDERGRRDELELLPPAPNPAAGPVSVTFILPREETVELGIFDVAGARVARLAQGAHGAGLHTIAWNGRDDHGRIVGAGLYWFRLVTPDGRATRMIARTR